jgi:hypothetical protein
VINNIYQKTGVFDTYTLTSIALIDRESSSLMFVQDEMALNKNIDSLADQIIDFNTDECKLVREFVP